MASRPPGQPFSTKDIPRISLSAAHSHDLTAPTPAPDNTSTTSTSAPLPDTSPVPTTTPPSGTTAPLTTSSTMGNLSAQAINACLSYAVASTSVTIMNKIVFSHAHFHYPWFTLAVQNLISVASISAANYAGLTKSGTLSLKLTRRMPLPIVFFVFFIFTNAQSLRYVNLPILTVWKSFGPMFVTLFERFYFRDRFSTSVYLSMLLIVLSAFVTAINDLEYSAIGYFWAFLNVVSNVAYLASLRIYLKDQTFSSLDKTFHSNLLSIVPIIPMSLISGEFPSVLNALAARSAVFKLTFLLSGFLTTAVCASAFWTISVTNGSTLSFIGGFNKVPIILLSLFLFDMKISTAGWVGVTLGVVAGILFINAKSTGSSGAAYTKKVGSPNFSDDDIMEIKRLNNSTINVLSNNSPGNLHDGDTNANADNLPHFSHQNHHHRSNNSAANFDQQTRTRTSPQQVSIPIQR